MSQRLPIRIYRAAQVRELDRRAIEELGIPGYTLMYRAGEAAFLALRRRWPSSRRLLVLCGSGNNAGDGYVVARIARSRGIEVCLVALNDPERLSGDARVAWETFREAGGSVAPWQPDAIDSADVVVDALIGTGLARPLTGRLREVVEAVNAARAEVLALDIPSGLHADTGEALGVAIRAQVTATFVGLKLGLYTGDAFDHVGRIVFDDLGIPARLAAQLPCAARRIAESQVRTILPRRPRSAHKGQHGHVLVIGGNNGMGGAVILAGAAALRCGAGRVTVATRPAHVGAVLASRPELMCLGVADAAALQPLLAQVDVVALGPGLGRDAWARSVYAAALAVGKPLVVDADALNLLAADPVSRGEWVLTPHPGEAARLLATTTAAVQQDRLAALRGLVERYGGTVVLKGAGTLVGGGSDAPWICDRGNPGMAAPGMGDVLTGVIAGLAAQTGELPVAARCGVFIHAAAGDDAARRGERGLVAGDLLQHLVTWVNAG